jgi:2-polyprenyl-3-methyl-5-hydroxy-6-metoxy-1,4-benzoquinol methylase
MYTEILKQKIIHYYTKYYRDDCSLPNYQELAEARVNEEQREKVRMEKLLEIIPFDFRNTKQFIMGAGTGGLAINLTQEWQAEVHGNEPNEEALEIIKDKCKESGIEADHFNNEYGEDLKSASDNQFDFVHCHTVIEHVADVRQCLVEMIRITKPGGYIIIGTPNYSYPHEGHYKIIFPTFLPKWCGQIYLKLLGKDPKFLSSINYVTESSINKTLAGLSNLSWLRIYHTPPRLQGRRVAPLINWLNFKVFIYKNQEIIIKKMK